MNISHHKRLVLSAFLCLLLSLFTITLLLFIPKVTFLHAPPTMDMPFPQEEIPPNIFPKLVESYGKLPLTFEANIGQTDRQVKFLARNRGYTLFLTPKEAVLALHQQKSRDEHSHMQEIVRLQLIGANATPEIFGIDEQRGISNYLIGGTNTNWYTQVRHYAKVRYKEIYPGVDLVYYGNPQQLEYDLILAPGINVDVIQFQITGADSLRFDPNNNLILHMPGGKIIQKAPIIYQDVNTKRQRIDGQYVLRDENRVGFEVAAYNENLPLVIDPILSYATFLGGFGSDVGNDIIVDDSNNVYITGNTSSSTFPAQNAFQSSFAGGSGDVFVTKLSPSGSLLYSTFLGGSTTDEGYSIAADHLGNVYVTGFTNATDFPIKNAFQKSLAGVSDGFVAKLDASGALVYSTYLGGTKTDNGSGIAVDGLGQAYVAGVTSSTDFPTQSAVHPAFRGGFSDGFVTKLDPSGALIYSTYLGGSGLDQSNDISADSLGNAYIAGMAISTDFNTQNAFQPIYGGNIGDGFVTALDPAGSVIYSTYLGGNGRDEANSISVDQSGGVYVTGWTTSTNFPISNALQNSHGGGFNDGFVTALSPSGSLVYSTYLGGSGNDRGYGISTDPARNAYVAGNTTSTNFPIVSPIQNTLNGNGDVFITAINASGSLVYSTYLGGNGFEVGRGIAADASGSVYLAGSTDSGNFPTVNAIQTSFGGGGTDAFVVKLASEQPALFVAQEATGFIRPVEVPRESEVQVFSIGLIGNGIDSVHSVSLTVSDLSRPTGLEQIDFLQMKLYKSGDATLDSSDMLIGSIPQEAINLGTPTTISATVPNVLPPGVRAFYLVSIHISPDAAAGHAFKVGFSAEGVTTSIGGMGTIFVASDLNHATIIGTQTGQQFIPSIAPYLLTSHDTIIFAGVPVGQSASWQAYIYNAGNTDLSVKSITASSNQFSVIPTTPFTVSPSGRQALRIIFAPTSEGDQSATLTIASNDPNNPNVLISVSGTARPSGSAIETPPGSFSSLVLSPNSLNFGNLISVGSTGEQSLVMTNSGNAPLLILNIHSSDSDYTFAPLPTKIQPEEAKTIRIRFSPQSPGEHNAIITIFSNAEDKTETTLSITATAPERKEPKLTGFQNWYGFGDVIPGKTDTLKIRFTNAGNADLIISQITSNTEMLTTRAYSDTIMPGSEGTLEAVYTPVRSGYWIGQLNLQTNLAQNQVVSLSFDGSTSLLLDDFVLGTEATGHIGLKNGGERPLQIDSIRAEITSGHPPSISSKEQFPLSIPAADSTDLNITVNATEAGSFQGHLILYTQNANASIVYIPFEGTVKNRPIPGDFDLDGLVDFSDFILFAQHYGKKKENPGFDSRFDLDNDGSVGFADFIQFAGKFGQ